MQMEIKTMTMGKSLADEFEFEAQLTRKLLERVPDDQIDFKPHEKSFTLGRLACHLVENLEWVPSMIETDHFQMKEDEWKPFNAKNHEEMLKKFDELVPGVKALIAACPDEKMFAPWKMTMDGKEVFHAPRMVVIRGFLLNHTIHHRGQLTVYLRLCDVPLPAIYGPSADDQGFG